MKPPFQIVLSFGSDHDNSLRIKYKSREPGQSAMLVQPFSRSKRRYKNKTICEFTRADKAASAGVADSLPDAAAIALAVAGVLDFTVGNGGWWFPHGMKVSSNLLAASLKAFRRHFAIH